MTIISEIQTLIQELNTLTGSPLLQYNTDSGAVSLKKGCYCLQDTVEGLSLCITPALGEHTNILGCANLSAEAMHHQLLTLIAGIKIGKAL